MIREFRADPWEWDYEHDGGYDPARVRHVPELSQIDACDVKSQGMILFLAGYCLILPTLPGPKVQPAACNRDRDGCPDK
jgi:hypothetical protein